MERGGEGHGEIQQFRNAFFVNNKLIIIDNSKLHYFTKDAKFIKSIPNNSYQRYPRIFVNENEFIHAPLLIHGLRLPDNKGKIARFNLKTREEKVLAEFSAFKGRVETPILFSVEGLTPNMIISYHNNKVYYGKKLNPFSLERTVKKASNADIRKHVEDAGKLPISKDHLEQLIKSLPRELTFFHRIQENNGLIYFYEGGFGVLRKKQQPDIFSLEGKNLYRSVLSFEENLSIRLTHITIKDNHLYLVLEDDEGEITMTKYKISLPEI